MFWLASKKFNFDYMCNAYNVFLQNLHKNDSLRVMHQNCLDLRQLFFSFACMLELYRPEVLSFQCVGKRMGTE